jgi:hypothetical protein
MKASISSFIHNKVQLSITEVPQPGEISVVQKNGPSGYTVLTGAIQIAGNMSLTLPWSITDLLQEGKEFKIFFSAGSYRELVDIDVVGLLSTIQLMQVGVSKEIPSSVQRIAACTICYNEDFIIKKWAEYYGGILGFENLFIVDDGSDTPVSEILAGLPVNITRVPRTSFDTWRLVRTIGALQRVLLETYDVVISMDSDEFIVLNYDNPECDFPDFSEYLKSIQPENLINVATVGFHVIHSRSHEPDLDNARPVMTQRKYVRRVLGFDKPLISSIPTSFGPGLHLSYFPKKVDNNLILLHLRYFDYNFAVSKLIRYQNTAWSEYDLQQGYSHHQRAKIDECNAEFESFSTDIAAIDASKYFMDLGSGEYGVLSESLLGKISI